MVRHYEGPEELELPFAWAVVEVSALCEGEQKAVGLDYSYHVPHQLVVGFFGLRLCKDVPECLKIDLSKLAVCGEKVTLRRAKHLASLLGRIETSGGADGFMQSPSAVD